MKRDAAVSTAARRRSRAGQGASAPREAQSTVTALLPTTWRAHDELEALLTEAARRTGGPGYHPLVADAVRKLWQAHDLVERATLELHACLDPKTLDALMRKAA